MSEENNLYGDDLANKRIVDILCENIVLFPYFNFTNRKRINGGYL